MNNQDEDKNNSINNTNSNLFGIISILCSVIISILAMCGAIYMIATRESVDLPIGMIMSIIAVWAPSPINFQSFKPNKLK
jgi:hypothetical protein